jgi:hypothetical protein
MGQEWQTPSWLPALEPFVESSSVEHPETIAESFRGLADIDPDAPDLLSPTEPQ